MFKLKMCFISLILFVLTFDSLSHAEKPNNTFVATNDWKEIQEDQSIPAGLHVRINLQTGKKEAKILEESEEEQNKSEAALVSLPESILKESTTNQKLKLKLKKKQKYDLKTFPHEQLALEYSAEKLKILNSHKSYKEIKKTYEDLRTVFKTDAEVITQLIKGYRKSGEQAASNSQTFVSAELSLLENFNTLVHQIDNALWFIEEGGLELVLLPNIVNQTNLMLRVQAMRVLGAISQNNPKAKVNVFERNFGMHLAQILSSSTNSEELSVAIYAFSALLRNFPHAQQNILPNTGMQALVKVLSKQCELSIKAKAARLIYDLVVEKQLILSTENNPSIVKQYTELNFNDWLNAQAYCETLDSLISTSLYELLEQPDNMEYFTQALDSTSTLCAALWSQSPQLRHTLLTMKNRYKMSQQEFHMEVGAQIEKLVSRLYEVRSHEEL